MATVLKVFERWKEFLGERVKQAEKAGMTEETISNLPSKSASFWPTRLIPRTRKSAC